MNRTIDWKKTYLDEIAPEIFCDDEQAYSICGLIGFENAASLRDLRKQMEIQHRLYFVRDISAPILLVLAVVLFNNPTFRFYETGFLLLFIVAMLIYLSPICIKVPSAAKLAYETESEQQAIYLSVLNDHLQNLKDGRLIAKSGENIIPTEFWRDEHLLVMIDFLRFSQLMLPGKYLKYDIEIHSNPRAY